MENTKSSTKRSATKIDSSKKLTKKLTGQFKASSVLAQLYEAFSEASDNDIKELANQANSSNSVVAALAHFDTKAAIGKELGSWIISRRDRKVRVVIKAAKVAAPKKAERRPASPGKRKQRQPQPDSKDQVANTVTN